MKFHSLRRSLIASVFAFFAAALVASCGGSGAASNTQGGGLSINPSTGSIYSGVPTTFTILGGRQPYFVSTNEPALLPVPGSITGNTFTVVANNTGVVDVGQNPDTVPSRTASITVRDANGTTVIGTYNVLRNFLTGYGFTFSPTGCTQTPATGGTVTGNSVPAGCEVGIQFAATTNGNLHGDRQYRLEVIRGPFTFVDPVTGVTSNTITLRSAHDGVVSAIIRTFAGSPTQIAVLRIVDVGTGVYTDNLFTIVGGSSANTLTAIPAAFTFTGADSNTCGTGEGDVYVFDGTPPYAATSTDPNLVVIPIDTQNNPGVFRIRAVNSRICLTGATVIFTDRFGARTTVTVNTEAGANPPPAPPTPPTTVTPNTITLGCGQSGSVSVTGGAPPYFVSSATPGITATVTGNTVTITRAAAGSTGQATPTTTAPVNVTDGTTVGSVQVTTPTTCP